MKNVARVLLPLLFASSALYAQMGGAPGAFSRLGFGARGMAMGNAMSAVASGDIVGYYNPALLAFASSRNGSASFGFLSLDRKLNFLQYTQPLPPMGGLSFGIINSGVSNIDGRDADGEPTGPLKTSENQVNLGFAARFKNGFSFGLSFKLYHYQLYTDLVSTTIGLDIGAFYRVRPDISVSLVVRDINSKYKWDSSNLYGQSGATTQDNFPMLFIAGTAVSLPGELGIASAEVELSNVKTIVARAGVEVPIIPEVTVRGGVDRIDLKESGMGVRPSLGFSLSKDFDGWSPALYYAYVMEPFSPSGMHMISLAVHF
jgi:hypothetical protein